MIVIATRNAHKVAEIRALNVARGLDLRDLAEFRGTPDVVEDGTTFEENAVIKAMRYSLWLMREHKLEPPVVAEDSGLVVEALLGWPGVHSSRVAPTDQERIDLLLEKLDADKGRSAYFISVTALVINGHLVKTWRGIAGGNIAQQPRGMEGFGYDPVFEDPELGLTFAEMGQVRKNERSHRTRAWTQTLQWLRDEDLT